MHSLKILLIEGSARQVLPMAKALRKLGHHVTTYNSSRFDFGYASHWPHRKLLSYSNPSDEQGTLQAVLNQLNAYHYDLVIPMNDDMARLLSKHKQEVEKYTNVAVNNWDVFKIASDKNLTMQACMKSGIPCPHTIESDADLSSLKFPIVIKPRTGCGAVGFHVSDSADDATKYLSSATRKFGPCLIQEYIPQSDLQYKAELFMDPNGDIKSAVVFAKVRWYPVNGGSSTLNKTVDRPDIVESCTKLLKSINWRGYADIDLIQDPRDNIAKIIEINPRITGSVKICFKAGVNFAQQIIEDYLGMEVTPMMDYKKDIYLRYFQKDILWLIKSHDRFKSKPSWFNFKNNVDQIWDWKDPLPFISSSLTSFSKLKEDANKRK